MTRICIVQPSLDQVSETFLRAHSDLLPNVVSVVHSTNGVPCVGDQPVLSQHWILRAKRRVARMICGLDWRSEKEAAFSEAFKRCDADVVLAEYGITGVRVMSACHKVKVPLVVHFHGYDASKKSVLEKYSESYREMFHQASAIVAVSLAMKRQLISLGCQEEKITYVPYGIDCEQFRGASPQQARPTFVAVGRMVEKKAPGVTVRAFARVVQECPGAKLTMIGDGPLLSSTRQLVNDLDLTDSVALVGEQPHDVVVQEMRQARAFVQHSVVAPSGDSEGTPLAILEAGAMGLPVVATRHAGIPDVVLEGRTGFLVDEHDVESMAVQMLTLAQDPQSARAIGSNAAQHVRNHFTSQRSINRLTQVLHSAVTQGGS